MIAEIYILLKICEIGYLEQNTNFHSENTILEEVLEVFKDVIEMEKYLKGFRTQNF